MREARRHGTDYPPLTADSVTASLQVMLPAYVVLFSGLGLSYFLTPLWRLLATPPLAYAHDLLPLQGWAGLFLGIGALLGFSMVTRRRELYRFGLWLGVVCMLIWAAVFMLAAFRSTATYSAWLWPAFGATCCYASQRSLVKGERARPKRVS